MELITSRNSKPRFEKENEPSGVRETRQSDENLEVIG